MAANILDLEQIEDAIIQGREMYLEIMAKVIAEYIAPVIQQQVAMSMQQMQPMMQQAPAPTASSGGMVQPNPPAAPQQMPVSSIVPGG